MSHQEILAEHVVDIHKVVADFRDAFERIQSSSSQAYGVNKYFSSQSPMQKRLSIYNWNPGPRRGKEDAIEKQIAGKWHIITLQEASEYVEHEILHERFHVTHFAGCAIFLNKDTFHPDISVHDTRRGVQDHIVEGEQGWVLQGVLSRASFRRAAASGQKVFTVLSLHISNIFAKKKRHCQENHPDHSCYYDFSRHWFSCRSFQWHCLALSQPRQSQYYRWSVFWLCLVYAAGHPRHCGDPDPSRTIGRTSAVFLSPLALNVSGRSINMVPFPSLGKLLVYDRMIKAATMRHDFICISSIGTTNGTIKLTTTGTFASRNDQRVLDMELKNVTSAKFWATTRSWVRNYLRSLVPAIPLLIITKWPDEIWRQLLAMFPSSRVFSLCHAHHDPHVHIVQQKKNNCSYKKVTQKTTWGKFIILKKKVCLNVPNRFQKERRNPSRLRSTNPVKKWSMKGQKPFWRQRDQLLSEAKSEIRKYENQSGVAENYIRELKNKVESQELEIMSATDGYAYFRSQRDPLHGELAERERALRDTQLRGFHD